MSVKNVENRFVIEFTDANSWQIIGESAIVVDDIVNLENLLGSYGIMTDPGFACDLSISMLEALIERFPGSITRVGDVATLRRWHRLDDLPYKVHTNRELPMMLSGEKPFAAFYDVHPSIADFEVIPESAFDPYVKNGTFMKEECIISRANNSQTRMVFYAVPNEEWRIKAYILLERTAVKSGWNEGFERMQGSLLGYDDRQNDIYIEKFFRTNKF